MRLQDTADFSAGWARCPVTVTNGLRGHMILHAGSGAGPRAVGEVTVAPLWRWQSAEGVKLSETGRCLALASVVGKENCPGP